MSATSSSIHVHVQHIVNSTISTVNTYIHTYIPVVHDEETSPSPCHLFKPFTLFSQMNGSYIFFASNVSHTQKPPQTKSPPTKPHQPSKISISNSRRTTNSTSYAVTPNISTPGIDVYMLRCTHKHQRVTRMHSTLDAAQFFSKNPDTCTPCSWPTAFLRARDAIIFFVCTVQCCMQEESFAHPGPRKTLATDVAS